jgi:hypothetical protein
MVSSSSTVRWSRFRTNSVGGLAVFGGLDPFGKEVEAGATEVLQGHTSTHDR